MKVLIELETPEEREIFGATTDLVRARSTAIFFRREMVPVSRHDNNVPVGYQEALFIEVGLHDLQFLTKQMLLGVGK